VITTQTGIVHPTTNSAGILDAQRNHFLLIANAARANRHDLPFAPGSGVLVNLKDSASGTSIQGFTVSVSVTAPTPNPSYSYSFTMQPSAASNSSIFYLYLPAGQNATASITISSQGYSGSATTTVSGDAVASNVYANLLATNPASVSPYIAKINGTLTRDYSVLRDFPLTATGANQGFTVDVTTNGTITLEKYAPSAQTSTISFQGSIPTSSRSGLVNVTIPRGLTNNNGPFTVSVNGSPVKFTLNQNALSNQLIFSIPTGQSSVSITLTNSPAAVVPEFPAQTLPVVLAVTVALALFASSSYAKRRGSQRSPRRGTD
jgi:hypothetical protein